MNMQPFEPVDNLPVMSSTDVLGRLILLLHMMLPGSPERLALEVNIDRLVEAYKLVAALRDSSTPSVAHIGEMDMYVTNLQRFRLAHVVSEEESQCLLQSCMDSRPRKPTLQRS